MAQTFEKREGSPSLVYGKNPVAELLKSGAGVDTVLISEGLPPQVAAYYTALAKQAGAVAKRVNAAKLRLTCGTDSHQGVAAWASEIRYAGLEELLAAAEERGEAPFLVLADGLEDPHNLGAVIRSALLCGAHGVVIPKRGGAAVTPTVLKSSAGAAGGKGGQHRRGGAQAQGAGRVRVLRRDGGRAPGNQQSDRPHRAGDGQRGPGRKPPGEKAVRRRGEPFHGGPRHGSGQL